MCLPNVDSISWFEMNKNVRTKKISFVSTVPSIVPKFLCEIITSQINQTTIKKIYNKMFPKFTVLAFSTHQLHSTQSSKDPNIYFKVKEHWYPRIPQICFTSNLLNVALSVLHFSFGSSEKHCEILLSVPKHGMCILNQSLINQMRITMC